MCLGRALTHQLRNRRVVTHEVSGAPLRRVIDLARVDAELAIDRGSKVFWRHHALNGRVTIAVGRANHYAPWRFAAGHQDAHGVRPMVAAAILVDLRRAAEL